MKKFHTIAGLTILSLLVAPGAFANISAPSGTTKSVKQVQVSSSTSLVLANRNAFNEDKSIKSNTRCLVTSSCDAKSLYVTQYLQAQNVSNTRTDKIKKNLRTIPKQTKFANYEVNSEFDKGYKSDLQAAQSVQSYLNNQSKKPLGVSSLFRVILGSPFGDDYETTLIKELPELKIPNFNGKFYLARQYSQPNNYIVVGLSQDKSNYYMIEYRTQELYDNLLATQQGICKQTSNTKACPYSVQDGNAIKLYQSNLKNINTDINKTFVFERK
jgi:hypothetical protein